MNEELRKALKWLEAITRGVGQETVVGEATGHPRIKKWTWRDRDAAESAVFAIFEAEHKRVKDLLALAQELATALGGICKEAVDSGCYVRADILAALAHAKAAGLEVT
jgi:hypothetical protein